jgi:hypothetical protein
MTITEATIYWDAQDPDDEGWAWRIKWNHGGEESGPWDAECDGSITQLEEAVVSLAGQHGATIETGMVACEPDIDGGYAVYTAS